MSGTLYKQYRDKVFTLARTMLIKHDEIATSINNELIYQYKDKYYPLADKKKTWRYYLNLAGEYHQYDIDILMEKYGVPYMTIKVPANDGSKEVPFTKALFTGPNADLSLANELAIGSKLYNEMVIRYPEQESLIIGIINPIDLDTAIHAENGEILYIDGFYKVIDKEDHFFVTRENKAYNVLIEEQEHNLILEIQRHIYDYLNHWVNAEYINGNDLYTLTCMGIFYSQLPNIIMNIRLGNCRTNYAHTFHIKQYLESFGQLGRYVDFIPIESALWLYRNVMYLEANRGKQGTFHSIIDNLWTPNKIPLNAYNIRHQLARMNKNNLLPTGVLYKEILNFKVRGISDDDRTNRDILNDQVPLARDNGYNLDEKDKKIQSILDWSGDDKLQTKVLETEMMELGDPLPFDLATMLMNHWGYTAHKGDYTGTLHVTNSLNGERIGITPLNAYLLTIYCLNYAVTGIKLKEIPETIFYDIPKTDFILDSPTDRTFELKPDLVIAYNWVDQRRTRKQKVQEILGTHKPKFKAGNAIIFKENVTEIFEERKRKYYTYSNTEDFHERADLQLVAQRCYWSGFKEQLATGNYQEWLRRIGIDFNSFQKEDYLKLALDLITTATGFDKNEYNEKKWLQKAMVSIMKHFISYTVHLIEKFADGVVSYLAIPTVRYCNFNWRLLGNLPVKYNIALDYWTRLKLKQSVSIEIPNVLPDFNINITPNTKVDYDLSQFGITHGKEIRRVGTYPLSCTILKAGMYILKNRFDKLPKAPKNSKGVSTTIYQSKPLLVDNIDIARIEFNNVTINTEYIQVYDPFPVPPANTIVKEHGIYHSTPLDIIHVDRTTLAINTVTISTEYVRPPDPLPNAPDKIIVTNTSIYHGKPFDFIYSDNVTIGIGEVYLTTEKVKDIFPPPPRDELITEKRYIVSDMFTLTFNDSLFTNVDGYRFDTRPGEYADNLTAPNIEFNINGQRVINYVRIPLAEQILESPNIEFDIIGKRVINYVKSSTDEQVLEAPNIEFNIFAEEKLISKPEPVNDTTIVDFGFEMNVTPAE